MLEQKLSMSTSRATIVKYMCNIYYKKLWHDFFIVDDINKIAVRGRN